LGVGGRLDRGRWWGMTRHTWRMGAVTIVSVAVSGMLLFFLTQRACRTVEQIPARTVQEAGAAAERVAARFKSGTITETFLAALPTLQPGGPVLELAAVEATETFRRTDERAVLFDLIPLGTNVTEIRVPVTYRYHVRLSDPWHLDARGPVCLVHAPRIHATLPPAIHTDRLERHAERGWLRFDLDEQMEALERSLTPRLSAYADSPAAIALVRETCRRHVADFVRTWLLREDQWRDGRFTAVVVVFEGEPLDPTKQAPVIEWRPSVAAPQR
jgi:hypothetical protein